MLAEDVPVALERLETVVAANEQLPEPEESAQSLEDEPAASLLHCALPVIELLKAAANAKCNVM